MFQGGVSGYPMPYWNTPTPMFPPFNPYMNMYGNPGMLPFSPVTPYGVPPYVASTYAAFPVPRSTFLYKHFCCSYFLLLTFIHYIQDHSTISCYLIWLQWSYKNGRYGTCRTQS